MKKTIFTILSIFLILIINITNTCCVDVGHVISVADDPNNTGVEDKVTGIMNNALGAFSVAGVAIAFAMLIFVGIKLMSAAPTEKAEVKKHVTVYVVGAVCILGSIFVLNVLNVLGSELTEIMK